MNEITTIQLVGGSLDGEEIPVTYPYNEYCFPRIPKWGFQDAINSFPDPIEVDVYVRLLDSNIFIYKGIREG